MKNLFSFTSLFIAVALFSGCITIVKPAKEPAENESFSSAGMEKNGFDYPDAQTRDCSEGSLWVPESSRFFLFSDTKARDVNDIITVRIMEEANATSNADTKVEKKSGMKSSISKFFGSDLSFGMSNLWGKKTGADTAAERTESPFVPELETQSDNKFDGTGTTVRREKLLATISAKVVDVLPNGNLYIKGRREVTINNEKQLISLSGIVRPDDVSPMQR